MYNFQSARTGTGHASRKHDFCRVEVCIEAVTRRSDGHADAVMQGVMKSTADVDVGWGNGLYEGNVKKACNCVRSRLLGDSGGCYTQRNRHRDDKWGIKEGSMEFLHVCTWPPQSPSDSSLTRHAMWRSTLDEGLV